MRQTILLSVVTVVLAACANGPGPSGIAGSPEIAAAIEAIDASRLRDHVAALVSRGPRSLSGIESTREAAEYIERNLREFGLDVRREYVQLHVQDLRGKSIGLFNIVGEIRGHREPERILELCAHYDSVEGSPGADDNASGVAGVLEVARVLGRTKPTRTLRFVFFCLEEYGKGGSKFHVREARKRDESIDGALVLEMIGYATDAPGSQQTPVRIPFLVWPPGIGNFITVVGNWSSGGLGNDFESAIERHVPELPYFSVNRLGGMFGDSGRSDHEAYWNHGYRGIMITDTANFRNPNYHQPSDTPDTLNYEFLRRVTQAAAATMLDWGA